MSASPSPHQHPLWFFISGKTAGEERWLTCPGSIAAGVQRIDHHIRTLDPSYDGTLSTLLSPYLEGHAHSTRCLPGSDDDHGARSAPGLAALLSKWESTIDYPVGTCILSPTYQWPFDVKNSADALDWVMRRVIESLTLRRLPRDFAFARFPDPRQSHAGEASRNCQFGPFNGVGLVLRLASCEELPPEIARLSVGNREKWSHYIHRKCGPLPVLHFPPLNHTLGTMVGLQDFTDEVAMDLYGVFSDCTIEVSVDGGRLPSFSAVGPPAASEPPTRWASGATRLTALNGATVLFLACLLLQMEDSIEKLLDMKTTGLVILRDMADHGLGWLIEPRDARAIIGRWLEFTDYHLTRPPPFSKLSLFLESWMSSLDDVPTSGQELTSLDLYRQVTELLKLPDDYCDCLPGEIPFFVGEQSTLNQIQIRSGIFQGCAAGTAMALIMGTNDMHHISTDRKPGSALETEVDTVTATLFESLLQLDGKQLMEEPAAASFKVYMRNQLQGASAGTLGNLRRLHQSISVKLDIVKARHSEAVPSFLFLGYFCRAFIVSVTGGRAQDNGENPLAWRSQPLRIDIVRNRHLLLGLSHADFRQLGGANTKRSLGSFLPAVLIAVCALSLGAAMFFRSRGRNPPLAPTDAAPEHERLGIGRVQSSFNGGQGISLAQGERVYILNATLVDWYKIQNVNGNVGVSPLSDALLDADAAAGPQERPARSVYSHVTVVIASEYPLIHIAALGVAWLFRPRHVFRIVGLQIG